MDEPDLPPLSQATREEFQAQPRPSFLLTRKRTHSDYDNEPATSSDPAMFSSDENAPGVENYVSGKRKKRVYRGSWWDRHPAKDGARKSKRKKREFRRDFDSGIFMGSESEEPPLSSDSLTMEDELLRDQQKAIVKNQHARPSRLWFAEDDQNTPRAKLAPKNANQTPKEHEEVCDIVWQCLDLGKEDVDLSSMSLSSLPLEITSLNTLCKQDEIAPGMLHIGTDLEPRLRLFLGNNLFTKVPSPILELRNIRFLSLRNNSLTSIPPGIRDMVNLESLNIAGNQLTELPFDLLGLVSEYHLQELVLDPNPWKRPATSDNYLQLASSGSIWNGNLHLRKSLHFTNEQAAKTPLRPIQNSAVPSLTELILRQLSKVDSRGETDFGTYMPSGSPQSVLDRLDFLRQHSDRQCSSCKRPIVLAAQERVEWWAVVAPQPSDSTSTFEESPLSSCTSVPFRRMLCWDGCRGS